MDVMIATVVVLIIMVQGVQSIGNTLSRKLNKNKLS
jgi:D-methionine transport system permease protein